MIVYCGLSDDDLRAEARETLIQRDIKFDYVYCNGVIFIETTT